jgi:hypothetical protein
VNFVARTRFEYPPATSDDFPVITHSFAIVGILYQIGHFFATLPRLTRWAVHICENFYDILCIYGWLHGIFLFYSTYYLYYGA